MAFNPAPSSWLADWSEDGTDISVPIATFPQLTAAEADGTTGDIRKVLFALADAFYQAYNAKAIADRPTKMAIFKNTTVDNSANVITQTFTLRFNTEITGEEVQSES